MLWYRVGSADETPGKSGLAHFLEHLMFKGTAKHPAGFSPVVATIGGQENAFTSSDYTGYFQRVPRDKLKAMMEFEADRMTGLVLTDEVVKPELNVVLEEHNMRVANNPAARLGEQMEAALYLNHPYGRPVIGWRQEIEQLNRQDALDFYRRFYTPNNAVLVVAGDVTPEEVKKLAEETYGKVPRVDRGRRRACARRSPFSRAPRTVTLADPRVTQPSLQRYYLVPQRGQARRERGSRRARAHSRSRRQQPALQGAGGRSGPGGQRRCQLRRHLARSDPLCGLWLAEARHDPAAARNRDRRSPRRASSTRASPPDELERAKNRMIADAIYANDSQRTLAQWYGAALTTGSTVDQVRGWPDRVRAVTAKDVQDAARKWLDKRRSVTGYLVKETGGEEKRS